ncbi:MAG: hypothetical protein AAGB00_07740 [Planctomycetota bacterium]
MRVVAITVAAVAASLLLNADAAAQIGAAAEASEKAPVERQTWFRGPEEYAEAGYDQPTPMMIIREKAKRRAMARIRRIETMNAYGMSNARPTANALPMTGMYSPAWQSPGGRPYAWYSRRAPQYIFWR